MTTQHWRPILPILLLGLFAQAVQAQTPPAAPPVVPSSPQSDPNKDRFPQPAPAPTPLPATPPQGLPTPPPQESVPPGPATISVQRVEVTGSTIFSAETLTALTRPAEGKTLTRELLINSTVIPITKLYLDRGFLTSRAELSSTEGGVVRIRVIEATISRVEVEGTERLNPDYVRSRVQIGLGTPLNTARLENQLRLLRTDPQFANVEATLRRGADPASSILIVRVTESRPFNTSFSIDNYSPPAVGSERGIASLLYRNPTGIGDEVSFGYSASTGASNIYDFNYRAPLNPMDGTLGLRVAATNIKVTEPGLASSGIRGTSELYELSYRQPLFRNLSEEFALSLSFSHQNGQTFVFTDTPFPFGIGPDANGVSRVSVIKFGQDYLSRDELGAWSVRSQFNFGTGLFGATVNDNPTPDSLFVSWLGQFSRLQLLGDGNLLIFQGELQLSFDPLLPAQQFVLGGVQSVRGYRQNIRIGDNGLRLSVEGRIPVLRNEAGLPVLQLAPFIEGGGIWNVDGNPNILPDRRFLATAGLGVLFEPLPGFNLRLDYGVPFVFLPDRGSNLQDNGFYFSLGYRP